MSDKKREEAESERLSIIEDKWVEDHSYILANTYIMMMQAELDRFMGSKQLVMDYFRDAFDVGLVDISRAVLRAPLIGAAAPPPIEIGSVLVSAYEAQLVARREGAQSANANGVAGGGASGVGGAAANAPAAAAGGKPGAKPNASGPPQPAATTKDKDAAKKAAATGAKAGAAAAAGGPSGSVAPAGAATAAPAVPSSESAMRHLATMPEKEHLVIDYENVVFPDIQAAYDFCINAIVQSDHSLDIPAAAAAASGDKREKRHTPANLPEIPESEPVQQPEHVRAIETEEQVVKYHLERIRQHAVDHLKELRTKGFEAFIQLDDWIGTRFQAEMDAARDMMNLIKEAIESEAKLPNQLILEGEKFQIDFGTLTLEPEPEPRPESPVEKICCVEDGGAKSAHSFAWCHLMDLVMVATSRFPSNEMPDQFTVLQLLNLARQLRIIAPSGKIPCKHFYDYIVKTAALSSSTDLLPESYCTADPQQFQQICYILDPFETGFLSWRKFLMLNSRTLPSSISSLAEMKLEFEKVMNGKSEITKNDYDQVYLWFEEDGPSKFEDSQIRPFARSAKFKAALFSKWS
eukprot:jgi/Hompol1/2273/HPOL_002152-RA